jgi:hypothetical protein
MAAGLSTGLAFSAGPSFNSQLATLVRRGEWRELFFAKRDSRVAETSEAN